MQSIEIYTFLERSQQHKLNASYFINLSQTVLWKFGVEIWPFNEFSDGFFVNLKIADNYWFESQYPINLYIFRKVLTTQTQCKLFY